VGGEWAAGAALIAESFADSSRPRAASLLQSAAAFGPIFAALANFGLQGQPWQWLFLVGVVPALFGFALRSHVKENPPAVQTATPISELWSNREWRRNVLAAMVIGSVGVTGAMTATYWQPNLVAAASTGMAKADVDARKSTLAMVSHIGTLAGVFVVPALCERFGRKLTIGSFFLASPLVVAAVIAGGATYERLLALSPLINFFSIGVSAAFVLYFPEMFPSRVRATGAGLAYNVGRVLAIPFPAITGLIIKMYGGSVATGVLLSGLVYIIGLAALPFAPETRGNTLPA
jgi:hypothetical protein